MFTLHRRPSVSPCDVNIDGGSHRDLRKMKSWTMHEFQIGENNCAEPCSSSPRAVSSEFARPRKQRRTARMEQRRGDIVISQIKITASTDC